MFRPIELLEHRVVSDKNPIEIEMRTRYTLKAVKKATEISSVVKIWVGDGTGSDLGVKEKEGVPNGEGDRAKIVRLEDRWDGKLPEGMFSEVSSASDGVFVLRGVGSCLLTLSTLGFSQDQRHDGSSNGQGAQDGGGGQKDASRAGEGVSDLKRAVGVVETGSFWSNSRSLASHTRPFCVTS